MAAPARRFSPAAGRCRGQVVDAAQAAGREVFVLAFEGETDPAVVDGVPHQWVPLGAVGRALEALHEAGSEDVVMIGPVRRPALASCKLGLARHAAPGQARARRRPGRRPAVQADRRRARGRGVPRDRRRRRDRRAAGARRACWPRSPPDAAAERDIAQGIAGRASRLGELDVGQAVVVQQGLVLGVEAVEGTDQLLARCAGLRRDGPGGVLVKLKKPRQERRADLPTIGPAHGRRGRGGAARRDRGARRQLPDHRARARGRGRRPRAACSWSASAAAAERAAIDAAGPGLRARRRAVGRHARRAADRGAAATRPATVSSSSASAARAWPSAAWSACSRWRSCR